MDGRKLLANGRARAAAWWTQAEPKAMRAAKGLGQAIARLAGRARRHRARATVLVRRAAQASRPAAERGWHAARDALAASRDRVQPWANRATNATVAANARLRRAMEQIAGSTRHLWARSRVWRQVRTRFADWRGRAAAGVRTLPVLVPRLERTRPFRQQTGRFGVAIARPLSQYVALASVGLLIVMSLLPAFASRALLNDLIFMLTMLALAQFWNLLAGYAGLVSVGQQAFVGLGGYLLFALTIHMGVDPLAAIALAGLCAAILALPTALVVFRLQGAYFAIGTWVVAEVYRLTFAQFRQLGGGTGTSLPPFVTNEVAGLGWVKTLFGVSTSAARDMITYWAALVLVTATMLAIYLLLRSRHGLALTAIRDSEMAAESVGVDNFKTKLIVYVMTAAGTGMVGALIYLQKARISPDAAFSVLDWTAYVIFIVVIGGIGTLEGPIVGVLVFYLLQTNLAHLGSWYLMLLGLFAILTMLFAPKGIWGYLSARFGLELFPLRRRLVRHAGRV